jgi:hypothetical protein
MTVQMLSTTAPFTPPSRTPHGTILDWATVVEGIHFGDADGLVWSYNCIGMDVDPVACTDYLTLTKRFDAPTSADGAQFVVQGGMTCKPFGFSGDDPALRDAFIAREGEAVSTGLFESLFSTAVDLTPTAGPVSPVIALGLLESYGYLDYSGVPIVHLGPGMISQLAATNAVTVSDGKLTTILGTPVAVSGGYESKTGGKLDQDQWAFVTGAVVLHRSEIVLQSQQDRSTNDIVVLYERLYVAGIDCLLGKVKVKVF